ncbi:MAG: hypothetical protein M3345_06625 [Actinomycetota bacterium]|nr:hypothetical protein [Actinomycetota bacterium]
MRAFDPLGALKTLIAHKVDFVLIGGLAARLHGSPSVTNDLDVCHDQSTTNLKRVAAALDRMSATLRLPDPTDRLDVAIDDRLLAAVQNLTLTTEFGALDLLARPAGTEGYQDLIRDSITLKLERGLRVAVASVDDLIRMKRASGRPKDLIEIEVLTALQDETGGGAGRGFGPAGRSDGVSG